MDGFADTRIISEVHWINRRSWISEQATKNNPNGFSGTLM